MGLRRPSALDGGIAAVVAAVGVLDLVDTVHGPRLVAAGAIAIYVVCIVLRRTSLWAVVLIAFSTIVVSSSLGLSQDNFLSSIIAGLVLVWWIGYAMRLTESVLAVCFGYACVASASTVEIANVVWLLLVIGGAWGAGRALRSRRLLIEDLRRTTAELESSREQLAARAVATERLRLAQEIHDIVAHSVTVMLVQAEAAGRLRPVRTDADATEAVTAVQDAGRQALAELRQLLGVLRPEGNAATSPPPGLGNVAALAASYRTAGLRVACTVVAPGDDVPATVQLTAYRVVQEALTNVLRHSDATDVRVALSRSAGTLRVEVVDAGPVRPGTEPPGHGLVGMRERAEACGGRLEAGPAQGGFRVAAVLPIASPSAREPRPPVMSLEAPA